MRCRLPTNLDRSGKLLQVMLIAQLRRCACSNVRNSEAVGSAHRRSPPPRRAVRERIGDLHHAPPARRRLVGRHTFDGEALGLIHRRSGGTSRRSTRCAIVRSPSPRREDTRRVGRTIAQMRGGAGLRRTDAATSAAPASATVKRYSRAALAFVGACLRPGAGALVLAGGRLLLRNGRIGAAQPPRRLLRPRSRRT